MNNSKKPKKKNRNKNKKKKNNQEESKENDDFIEKEKNQEKQNENEVEEDNTIISNNYNKFSNFYELNDEQRVQLQQIDFEKDLLKYISMNITDAEIDSKIKFKNKIFKNNNYILTREIKEKLFRLYTYMKNQIPCILEGETGTSKTFSVIILCKYLAKNWEKENLHNNFKLIRVNLSSESKISDLIGKYTGANKNSFAGIEFQPGPFITAFKEGHCLLLDEINLANSSLLQCIEEALDTKVLSIEVPGFPVEPIKMHQNFCLVATQNPNKGYFIRKRNELKKDFLSRFQIITFNEFTEKELFEICKGMIEENEFEKSKAIIHDLIRFHLKWIQEPEVKNDIKYFTLREITLFIEAFTDKDNKLLPYEIILIIYGSKYPEKQLDKLKNILKEYKSFKVIENENILEQSNNTTKATVYSINSKNAFDQFRNKINESDDDEDDNKENIKFENCFENKSLERAIKAINFAFKYGKNVLILGKKGVGKTQLALWIAEYFDTKNNIILNVENEKDVYLCICNEILKCSDFIGKQKPVDDLSNPVGELIKWENGFVVDGLIKGKCIILDRLEKVPPTVTERLNNLLDINYIHDTDYFPIPENPDFKDGIKINPNFRIIATVDEEELNKMSPAFINRFITVYLDDQLMNIKKGDIKIFSSIILNKLENDKDSKKRRKSNDSDRPNFMDEDDDSGNNNENLDKEIKEKILSKIEDIYFENRQKINIYNLAKLCRIIGILIKEFGNDYMDDIINIGKFLSYSKDKKINLNPEFKYIILKDFSPLDIIFNEEETFFFESSNELQNFLVILYICFITHTHICIEGKTGIGKTACARAFSELLKLRRYYIDNYRVFFFHNGTNPNDFYGSLTLDENKNISFCNGVLTDCILHKNIFIADELNLTSEETMNSLSPILEENFKYKVYIPGLSMRVKINNPFL